MRLREFFFGSLRRQLIFGVAAVHAVMMSLFVWDLTERQQDMLLDRQIEQAQALAQTLATSAAGWLAARDISGLQELAEAQRRYPQLAFAMLLDREGQVLAHTERARQGQYVRDLPHEAKLTLLARGSALVDAIAPAMLAGHAVGWARVGIGQQETREKLDAITRNGVLYALVAIAIGSILALLMGNRLTRKLYAMRRVSETVRAGRQEMRVPDLGGDEAGQLARDFNAMLDGLSSSEKRFTNIVNLATDAIISVDENQRICSFNTGAEQIFGYTTAEILGQLLDRLLPEHLAEAHREHIRRFAAGPDAARDMNRRAEIHGRRKDGTEFPAEASISKVKQNDKFQFTVFLRDITERRQAEEKIRKLGVELRQFKDTLDQTLDCVFMFRPDTLRFIYVNEGAKRQIGYNEVELLQMTPVDIKPEFSLERFQHVLRPMIDGVQPSLTFQTVHRHKNGHDIPVEIFLQLVHLEGQEPRFVAMVRDVTERKRIEQEIRQLNTSLERKVIERTAELETANKELEAFSYSVSHDLRAPLRGIDGFSQALMEDYADKLGDQGKGYLQRVRAASQRMAELIDDMLKLARVTRAPMQREPVDLSTLARSIAAELQRIQPQKPVDFVIEPKLHAAGDPKLLRVLLENLLANAWKFTGKQERPRIELGARRDNGTPVYFVRDNGAGFDMRYAHKLFGAFQRLHTIAEFPGTGIGLATVQRIVHRHGGRAWADAAEGHGATFFFTLSPEPARTPA
ncbi:MAG: PAS domain S-box protein [Gammaproteobacteria bacterium]|nr:PAS domain S-box protein [Gammaproteobacteria bacterium]